jgi:hypothetical protein
VLLGDVLDELPLGFVDDDELEALGVLEDWFEFRFVELDELLGAVLLPAPLMSTLFELELLEGEVAEPFRLMSVELDELLGADAEPFTLTSVELDELLGVDALPFRLIELDEELGVLAPLRVVEDEEDPGTTAMPGAVSVVIVLLLDPASGTLGMQPAGCVFAASVHFGSSRSFPTLVMVSARATPKAASIEAARRLILNVLRFISVPPFWTR